MSVQRKAIEDEASSGDASEASQLIRASGLSALLDRSVRSVWRDHAANRLPQPVRIGGIGNVKTHPSVRKQGFASLAIERAVTFLREQPLVFALLVCEQHLLGYYSRLGWKEFTGRLLIRQHGATTEFTLCRVMTLGLHSVAPETGTIDLCGPPW